MPDDTAPLIVTVAIPTPLRRSFDYRYQPSQHPVVGGRVRVPFGSQKLVGIVVGVSNQSDYDIDKLKFIQEVLDHEPLLPPSLFKLTQWSARYYQHPIGDVWTNVLPSALNKGAPAQLTPEKVWTISEIGQQAIPTIKANAIKQRKILTLAHQNPIVQSSLKQLDFSSSDLKKLVEKNWLILSEQEPTTPERPAKELETPFPLNDEQHNAVENMAEALDHFKAFLLHGVTGSGKTEVYMHLIQRALDNHKQVLVLVPEIGLTPQTVQRFQRRFAQPISMLHSGLTDKQRLDIWLQAKRGLTSVIIGTRSALFTPLQNPGLIIVDEEHDLSYKQHEGFRYSARDLAILRAQFEKVPVVLGSATPAMESYHNALTGKMQLLELKRRAANARPPLIKVLDIRQRHLEQGISQAMVDEIRSVLAKNEQCMVFLNRRGFAPNVLCHGCGWTADCDSCDRHMTYHHSYSRLHCHHCDRQRPLPNQCPSCGEIELIPIGLGTERLEEALQLKFPEHKIARVDRDTTRRKGSMDEFVSAAKNHEIDILVGTQMLAKGHHFPNLTLVCVVDIDGCLFSSDFRATERTAQLLTQVAGRAGRADKSGTVLIQTHHPEHPMLEKLFKQDYSSLSRDILAEREEAMMPPFQASALLRAEAHSIVDANLFLSEAASYFSGNAELMCLGPYPSSMPKRSGRMRAQLLLQAAEKSTLQTQLYPVIRTLEQLPSARKVRWSIDIDPQDNL